MTVLYQKGLSHPSQILDLLEVQPFCGSNEEFELSTVICGYGNTKMPDSRISKFQFNSTIVCFCITSSCTKNLCILVVNLLKI